MRHIGVTGTRELTEAQRSVVENDLLWILPEAHCHVGDAAGVDELAQKVAYREAKWFEIYWKRADLPHRAQGAERSTRMVKALAEVGGVLHCWINKPCPLGMKPSRTWPKNAAGSGTWGTVGLAVGLGLEVVVHKLGEFELPEWLVLAEQQRREWKRAGSCDCQDCAEKVPAAAAKRAGRSKQMSLI